MKFIHAARSTMEDSIGAFCSVAKVIGASAAGVVTSLLLALWLVTRPAVLAAGLVLLMAPYLHSAFAPL